MMKSQSVSVKFKQTYNNFDIILFFMFLIDEN